MPRKPHDIEPILDAAEVEIARDRRRLADCARREALAQVEAIKRSRGQPDVVQDVVGTGPAPEPDHEAHLAAALARAEAAAAEYRAADRAIRAAQRRIKVARNSTIVDPMFEGFEE